MEPGRVLHWFFAYSSTRRAGFAKGNNCSAYFEIVIGLTPVNSERSSIDTLVFVMRTK